MKRYDSYKDSGVKWIGEIPSHWQTIRIKWLLNERIERSDDGEGTPLSMSQKYGIVPTSEMDVVPNLASNYVGAKKVYTNDLVFNKLKAHLGVFAISKYNGLVSPDYAVYVSTKRAYLPFLEYLFHTQLYISEFKKKTTGVAIGFTRLYTDGLYAIYSICPPLVEQRTIVDYLNSKSSEIEQQISDIEREIELLKEYKQAEIARVVLHGLNSNAPTKPSGISWIGDIPAHWEVKRLGSAFTENRTLNSELISTEAYKFNYGALVRKDEDIALTDDVLETYKKYTVIKPNDILINGLNLNYDFVSQRVAMSFDDGIITSAYLAITPRENINPSYYCYLLKSMDAKKMFHGMGTGIRLTLSFAELKKQLILFPPMSEQDEIVNYINQKTTDIDRLLVELTYQVEYLKEYKQKLIADVVTGKINVQNS